MELRASQQPFWWMINEPSLAEAIMELSLLSCPPIPSSFSYSSSFPHLFLLHLILYTNFSTDAPVDSAGARHSRVMSIWVERIHCTTFTLHYFYIATTTNIQCAPVVLNSFLIALLCIGEGWRGNYSTIVSDVDYHGEQYAFVLRWIRRILNSPQYM